MKHALVSMVVFSITPWAWASDDCKPQTKIIRGMYYNLHEQKMIPSSSVIEVRCSDKKEALGLTVQMGSASVGVHSDQVPLEIQPKVAQGIRELIDSAWSDREQLSLNHIKAQLGEGDTNAAQSQLLDLVLGRL